MKNKRFLQLIVLLGQLKDLINTIGKHTAMPPLVQRTLYVLALAVLVQSVSGLTQQLTNFVLGLSLAVG